MTQEQVLQKQRQVFYKALIEQNWHELDALYADDYTLVRSDGSALTKSQVLDDLRSGGVVFISIELTDPVVRIIDSVAILTGRSSTRYLQAGAERTSIFRLVAVYANSGEEVRLKHFQSTLIQD